MFSSKESQAIESHFQLTLDALEGASTAMDPHERMMRILDAGTKHLDLLFAVGSGVSKVNAED